MKEYQSLKEIWENSTPEGKKKISIDLSKKCLISMFSIGSLMREERQPKEQYQEIFAKYFGIPREVLFPEKSNQ